MRKILIILIGITLLASCEMFEEPESRIIIEVENSLGGSYSYDLAIDGWEAIEGNNNVESGPHDVSITVFDVEGNVVGTKNKTVNLDLAELVVFYLEYDAPIGVGVK